MRQLGALALVVFGLLALVQGFAALASGVWLVPDLLQSDGGYVQLGLALTWVALPLAFGGMAIWKREPLARRLFTDAESPLVVDGAALLRVALVLMGLWLLLDSAQLVLKHGMNWIAFASQANDMDRIFGRAEKLRLIGGAFMGILEFAIATLLVVRSEPIAARLLRSSPAPAPKPTAAEPACPACGQPFDLEDYREGSTARCTGCGTPLSHGGA